MKIQTNKSVAGGICSIKNSFSTTSLSVSIGPDLKKAMPEFVDELVKLAIASGQVPKEVLDIADPLVKAILPSIKEGELDFAAATVGSKEKKLTQLFALKVKDGKALEKAVKETVSKLPPEYAAFVKVDAEKLSGSTMIHAIKVADLIPEEAVGTLGKTDIYIVFRDDLMLIALGADYKAVLQAGYDSKPADVGVLTTKVGFGRLLDFMPDDGKPETKDLREAIKKVYGKDPTGDQLSFTVKGGESLRIRLGMDAKLLEFFATAGAASQLRKID
jgi:hypothetical protein